MTLLFRSKSNWTVSAIAALSLALTALSPALAQSNPYHSKRTAGFGFSNPYRSSVNHPTFGIPRDQGGGYFLVPSGGKVIPMWKAPSGYLYPWAPRPKTFNADYSLPVLVVPKATGAASPAAPPLSVIMNDLDKFIELNRSKLTPGEPEAMQKKVGDIKAKERRLRITGKGSLTSGDEAQIRRELSTLGNELALKLKS